MKSTGNDVFDSGLGCRVEDAWEMACPTMGSRSSSPILLIFLIPTSTSMRQEIIKHTSKLLSNS